MSGAASRRPWGQATPSGPPRRELQASRATTWSRYPEGMNATVRNVLIVLALAALVALLPGGGTGANIAVQAVSLVFLGVIVWFLSLMYRQHRTTLYSLGDGRRAVLYVALGVAAVTLTATTRLWNTGGAGSVAWLLLLGGAAYAVFAVLWSARKY